MNNILRATFLSTTLLLAACQNAADRGDSTRHLKPISSKALTELEAKGMTKTSPILLRVFKQESELEVWKETKQGNYALFKTYPICKWSGELGPKVKEGDRQAPEGFYNITPAQMNPKSQYYLAFNIGFPNKFDQSYGRYGSHLMVHGDCSSRGCYAMTDEAIAEIYALARDSFEGGQKGFQLQAYPFRMTAKNMARHRNNPNMPFWKNLKEGNDHFETSKLEPKIEVCERKYVFNAEISTAYSAPVQMQSKNSDPKNSDTKNSDPWTGLKTASQVNQSQRVASLPSEVATPRIERTSFSASEKCPVYSVHPSVAPLVQSKQANDDKEIASLITYGIDAAPIKTGLDGGMHSLYAQKMNMPHLDRMAHLSTAPSAPFAKKIVPDSQTGLVGKLFAKKEVVTEQPPSVVSAPLPPANPLKVTDKTGAPVQMMQKK